MRRKLATTCVVIALFSFCWSGCVSAYRESVGDDSSQELAKYYKSDFNTAWQAVLDALKNSRLAVSNHDAGFIQTKWTNNTAEKNFADSFGKTHAYLKAQYRLSISVSKGFYNGIPAVKVTVSKQQLIQHDILEGWHPVETDLVDERTLLYRIGRLIYIHMKLAKLEAEKIQKEIQNTQF